MDVFPEAVSTFADSFDSLAALITVFSLIALVAAEGAILYACFRFRRGRKPQAEHFTGERWKHVKWVAIPVLIVAVMDFTIDARTHDVWVEMEEHIPEEATWIEITGQQFGWIFVLPGLDGRLETDDDVTTAAELHVPVDTDIAFMLRSRDVLHSFWVPALRLKLDAIPGRTMRGWFRARTTGTYDLGCAELCGAGHGVMAGKLHVHTPEDYRAWLSQQSD